MNDHNKNAKPPEHQGQNSNNLVKEDKGELAPVSRPGTDSVKIAGATEGLNQAAIDNNTSGPADSSDQ